MNRLPACLQNMPPAIRIQTNSVRIYTNCLLSTAWELPALHYSLRTYYTLSIFCCVQVTYFPICTNDLVSTSHWCNPLWLTGLKTPTDKLTNLPLCKNYPFLSLHCVTQMTHVTHSIVYNRPTFHIPSCSSDVVFMLQLTQRIVLVNVFVWIDY